jgi:phage shock protein C
MQKRLQRSRTEKMIGGVCGGFAEYFNVDPTLVRVIWVAMTLIVGIGFLLYLILWLVMPLESPAQPLG